LELQEDLKLESTIKKFQDGIAAKKAKIVQLNKLKAELNSLSDQCISIEKSTFPTPTGTSDKTVVTVKADAEHLPNEHRTEQNGLPNPPAAHVIPKSTTFVQTSAYGQYAIACGRGEQSSNPLQQMQALHRESDRVEETRRRNIMYETILMSINGQL